MSQATVNAIAEAVLSDLIAGAAEFALEFTPVRKPVARFELENIGDALHVVVINGADAGTFGDARDETSHEYSVAVVVFQHVPEVTNEIIDSLMALCEQIGEFWIQRNPGSREEQWVSTEIPPYDPELLNNKMLFLSAVKLTFFGTREVPS